MRRNPFNFTVGVSSPKGVVDFYSPNSSESLLKVLAHNSRVNSIDFSTCGNYMLSAGSDRQCKVFDIRHTFKELFAYCTPKAASRVCLAQTGVAAVASGSQVFFWKDVHCEKQRAPCFKHEDLSRSPVTDMAFVPFEDFMGVASSDRFESILVPGTGARDYDTFETNLNPEVRQNREIAVRKLIEKVR